MLIFCRSIANLPSLLFVVNFTEYRKHMYLVLAQSLSGSMDACLAQN